MDMRVGLAAQNNREIYAEVVKLVVASAVDPNGEQIHPRKWNHDFVGWPIVEQHKQHRPTITKEELEQVIARQQASDGGLLFALDSGPPDCESERLWR